MMKKILIVDDHDSIRMAYREFFGNSEEIVVAGEAGNGAEALELLRQDRFDLVLTDISMPVMDGFGLAEAMQEEFPDIPVVVMTQHDSTYHIHRMLDAQVRGYFLKHLGPTIGLSALQEVLDGGQFFSEEVMPIVLGYNGNAQKVETIDINLSSEEIEILNFLAAGEDIATIARYSMSSEAEITKALAGIREKTGQADNEALLAYAITHNLVDKNEK